MFTTKFTKPNRSSLVSKFAEGGEVPLPTEDPRGNDYRKGQRRIARESEGASDRTWGEHAKALARAIFEPKEFREVYESGGKRDRSNPLYDRKQLDE
jgi:hypothetical protein